MISKENIKKISDYLYEIPKGFRDDMAVPARFYASEKILDKLFEDKSLEQLLNVATLAGIWKYSLAMPDMHEGYGFPIGGVAAIDARNGVISPGGVGYDINCGVRLLSTNLYIEDVRMNLNSLAESIYTNVPSGVGRGGNLRLASHELAGVLRHGARWAVESGYGEQEDLINTEENGEFKIADPNFISEHAKRRGKDQIGTLGAGNHFLEIQAVEEIFDEEISKKLGIEKNKVCVMIHTGSRGLGHQVCADYVRIFDRVLSKYKIKLIDRELACAPFMSEEGQKYFRAMACAANFAWCNRQVITHRIREAFKEVLGSKAKLAVVYDVAHNIAKIEKFEGRQYIVHRKGATRSFPNQPVIIPGSMGTFSYVLVGTEYAVENTFGSTCHGAGRNMSRHRAIRTVNYNELMNNLKRKGIIIKAGSKRGLLEEAPQAYKNIDDVVEIVHNAVIAKKVVKLKPLAAIKG